MFFLSFLEISKELDFYLLLEEPGCTESSTLKFFSYFPNGALSSQRKKLNSPQGVRKKNMCFSALRHFKEVVLLRENKVIIKVLWHLKV